MTIMLVTMHDNDDLEDAGDAKGRFHLIACESFFARDAYAQALAGISGAVGNISPTIPMQHDPDKGGVIRCSIAACLLILRCYGSSQTGSAAADAETWYMFPPTRLYLHVAACVPSACHHSELSVSLASTSKSWQGRSA